MRLFPRLLPLLLLICVPAWGHRLVQNDGTHDSVSTALEIEDPGLSQLVLQELSAESSQLWLSFQVKAGEDLYFQLGLPDISDNRAYRPALALLGPGLPAATGLPFDVPEGYGALVFDSADAAPQEFHEPFTGTDSLTLLEETETAEMDAVYYLVLYDPEGAPGKAWVAIGKREAFGVEDLVGFSETVNTVRSFHGVSDEPMPLLTRVLVAVSRFLTVVITSFGFIALRLRS
jgi:hypothetical protein